MRQASGLIQPENSWQSAPAAPLGCGDARIGLARWRGAPAGEPMEVSSGAATDTHFITYSLRPADVDFAIGRKQITGGIVAPQRVLLQGPTADLRRSIYRSGFDFFRIFFSQTLLKECVQTIRGQDVPGDIALFDAHFIEDPAIERLTRMLAQVDESGGAYGPSFVDGVGIAIAIRLVSRFLGAAGNRTDARPLDKCRLARVAEYLAANLHRPIQLAEMSDVAGLSKMHFAARFKAATGTQPHIYLLKMRIARSQALLLDSPLSLAEVATATGFRDQAQYSTAFRNVTGAPPGKWRDAMLGSNARMRQ